MSYTTFIRAGPAILSVPGNTLSTETFLTMSVAEVRQCRSNGESVREV